jgi:hypothetical protein
VAGDILPTSMNLTMISLAVLRIISSSFAVMACPYSEICFKKPAGGGV